MTLKELIDNLSFQSGDALERTVWLLLGRGKPGIRAVAGALKDSRVSSDLHRYLSNSPDRLLELLLTVPETSWDASVKSLLQMVPPGTLGAKGRELWSRGAAAQGHALLAMAGGEAEPDADPDSLCRLGDSLRATEQWGRAEEAYRRGLLVKGDHAGLCSGLSRVWLHWIRSGAKNEFVASLAAWERADQVRDVVFEMIRLARQEAWEDIARFGDDLRDFGRRLHRIRELTEDARLAGESLSAIRDSLLAEARAGHNLALELTRLLQGYEQAELRPTELEALVREAAALTSGSELGGRLVLAGNPARVLADPHLMVAALGNILDYLTAVRQADSVSVTWGSRDEEAEIRIGWDRADSIELSKLNRVRQMLWKQGAEIALQASEIRIAWPPMNESPTGEVLSERRQLARVLVDCTRRGVAAEPLPGVQPEDLYPVLSDAITLVADQALGESAQILSFGVHDLKNGFVFAGNWAEQFGDPATPRGLVIERISSLLAKMERWLADLRAYLELNDEPTFGYHKASEILEEALRTVSATLLKAGVRVYRDLPRESPHIHGDKSRLVSALANLFLNAAEAMRDGGLLAVAMVPVETLPVEKSPAARTGGRAEVEIAISDTGPGLTPERLAYVTGETAERPGGTGRGIGLAAVRRIVSEHAGSLRIEAEDGGGTRISISLPFVDTDHALRTAVEGFDRLNAETKKALRAAEGFFSGRENLSMAGFLTLKAVELELQARVLDKLERHRILPSALALQQAARNAPKSIHRPLTIPGGPKETWTPDRLTAVVEGVTKDRLPKVVSDWRNGALLLWLFGRTAVPGEIPLPNPLGLAGLSEEDLARLCLGLVELEIHRGQLGPSVTAEGVTRVREAAFGVLGQLLHLWVSM